MNIADILKNLVFNGVISNNDIMRLVHILPVIKWERESGWTWETFGYSENFLKKYSIYYISSGNEEHSYEDIFLFRDRSIVRVHNEQGNRVLRMAFQ